MLYLLCSSTSLRQQDLRLSYLISGFEWKNTRLSPSTDVFLPKGLCQFIDRSTLYDLDSLNTLFCKLFDRFCWFILLVHLLSKLAYSYLTYLSQAKTALETRPFMPLSLIHFWSFWTIYRIKTVDISRIQTWIVEVEGKHADNLTTSASLGMQTAGFEPTQQASFGKAAHSVWRANVFPIFLFCFIVMCQKSLQARQTFAKICHLFLPPETFH